MKPLIIFITGGPGTGKSYTARQLKDHDDRLQVLSYDLVKEIFWERYGFRNREEKDRVDSLALERFYDLLDEHMYRKEDLIAEYPFYQRHRERLEQLVKKNGYDALTLLLEGDRHVIYEREKKRNTAGRHPAHVLDVYDRKSFDSSRSIEPIVYSEEEFWKKIENKDYDIGLGRTIRIDVTDFDRIDLKQVTDIIDDHLRRDPGMSKLIEMTEKFPDSELWTDSFNIEDHEYGLSQGAKGVTTSPTWVAKMICDEPFEEKIPVIERLHHEHPEMNEQELTWALTLEMAKQRSRIMLPLWQQGDPKKGRFSVQTSIYEYNNGERILQMAREVNACGDNMQVKIPCTEGGIWAIEEATYEDISCMGTQCFSLDQALAAAEAVEAGLRKREAEGLDISQINPMIALLPGMQDETLKSHCDRLKLVVDPIAFNWGGIAVAKKTIAVLKQRNYRIRPLIAYYRSYLHWSQFIGADCAQTIPVKWQKRLVDCDIEIRDWYHEPVDEKIIDELRKLPLFTKVYNEGSMKIEDFVRLEPVVNTFRYFTSEYQKAVEKIRDVCLSAE